MLPRKLLFVLFLLLSVVAVTIIPKHAFAQTSNSYPDQTQTNTTNPSYTPPPQLHELTQNVLIEVLAAVSCQVAGVDPTRPNGECLGITNKGVIGYAPSHGGALGVMGGLIASTFQINISSRDYVNYLSQNFGIVKHAYAADTGNITGFDSLKPFLPLWVAFRNVVYLFFVFVFLVIGFAIMLRIKIDPRTVMTVQNSLPKLVVAIILITFSYAIVGVLVDFMWLACYLVYAIIQSSGTLHASSNLNPINIQGQNPLSALGFGDIFGIIFHSSQAVSSIIASLFQGTLGNIIGIAIATLLGFLVAGPLGPFIGIGVGLGVAGGNFATGGGGVLGLVGGIIAFIVIALAVLVSLFKLWFSLLKAYLTIIFLLVLGPFWIACGVIPGVSLGFGRWLRSLLSNFAAFPATFFMFLMGEAIINAAGHIQKNGQFVPPFIGNPSSPDAIASLLGLSTIMLTPHIVTIIHEAIQTPQGKSGSRITGGLRVGNPLNAVNTGSSALHLGERFQRWRAGRAGGANALNPENKT